MHKKQLLLFSNKNPLIIFLMSLFLLVPSCSHSNPSPFNMGKNFDNSLDGRPCEGEWRYRNSSFDSLIETEKGVLYSKDSKESYCFSFNVKVDNYDEYEQSGFGGYAFYKDIDHNLSFFVDPSENTMKISYVNNFESDERVNYFDKSYDLNEEYYNFRIEKIGNDFKFYINNLLFQTREYSVEGQVQVGFISKYCGATFDQYVFDDIEKFSDISLARGCYKILPRRAGSADWACGNTLATVDSGGTWSTLLFESQATNMILDVDVLLVGARGSGTPSPLMGATVYTNSANWTSVFFSGSSNKAEVYQCENGWSGYTGPGFINNFDVTTYTNIRIEKVGTEARIYLNDKLFKLLKNEIFLNAQLGLEAQDAVLKYKINEYKEIKEFSEEYEFDLMDATNFNYDKLDNGYKFLQSSGGLWGGDTIKHGRKLDGGLHLGLSNCLVKDYSFETLIKPATLETSCGLLGVICAYTHTGNGLYLLIDTVNDTVDLLGTTLTNSWFTPDISKIDLYGDNFGLNEGDDIPVKVIKNNKNLDIYINNIPAFNYSHAYFKTSCSFGIVATSPLAISGQSGQYDALFINNICKFL